MKTCYNILYESLDVVKALVPAYISTNDTIHHQARGECDIVIPLTPVSYWYYYDNTVMNICGPHQEYFDKDARILEYLELAGATSHPKQ